MKEKICPFMSRSKLSRFEGHTPSTDGSYDEFVYCQKEDCMAWIPERHWKEGDINVGHNGYCKLIYK